MKEQGGKHRMKFLDERTRESLESDKEYNMMSN